jgi:hypothetical protein
MDLVRLISAELRVAPLTANQLHTFKVEWNLQAAKEQTARFPAFTACVALFFALSAHSAHARARRSSNSQPRNSQQRSDRFGVIRTQAGPRTQDLNEKRKLTRQAQCEVRGMRAQRWPGELQ